MRIRALGGIADRPDTALLHREIDKAMAEPEAAQKLAVLGFEEDREHAC